jgi:methylated-DNA-[protein]-cysteine S-methyltransferase
MTLANIERAGTSAPYDTATQMVLPSVVGPLVLRGTAEALTQVILPKPSDEREGAGQDLSERSSGGEIAGPVLEAARQLEEYFAGERRVFELALALTGTPFQRRVWVALAGIEYGQTISYAELADRVGSPRAFRAVGQANGANPIPIIVPCHRVVASGGGIGGYGGGLDMKRRLLAIETQGPR